MRKAYLRPSNFPQDELVLEANDYTDHECGDALCGGRIVPVYFY